MPGEAAKDLICLKSGPFTQLYLAQIRRKRSHPIVQAPGNLARAPIPEEYAMTEQHNPETSPTSEGKRRGFFKRLGIATLIGGLASGVGFSVLAQGRPGGWHHHRGGFMDATLDPAKMDQRIEYMVKHLAVDIDATPEQTGKLVAIAKSAAGDLRPLRDKVRSARKRGVELLAAQSVDRSAIESLRVEQIQAADAASRRLSVALGDIAEVLTPEQRTKLKQHFEKRFERRGAMHHRQG